MASAIVSNFLLPHPATLCPPPLRLQKRTRRATIRRRILRKTTQNYTQSVQGPLDDIIAEIKSDIRDSPPDYIANPSFLDWSNPLKAPSTWAMTPLPVSRAPSDQPLTIRKNRNSRSSASGSSMGDTTSYSRNNSRDEATNDSGVGINPISGTTPWPLFDSTMWPMPEDFTKTSSTFTRTAHATAQQSLESAVDRADGHLEQVPQRRPSRLRMFTNGFPRLRPMGTAETCASTGNASGSTSPTATRTPPIGPEDLEEPSDEAVDAYMKRNAHNYTRLHTIMERMAKRLPIPSEDEQELKEDQLPGTGAMPTTLKAAIRVFPELKILSEDLQEFSIAIEIEGVLQNCNAPSCTTVDVVFVVDNGYYVTKDCLERAIDAVNGALYHMRRGDRLALYSTHCAHNPVTGNRPELLHPMRPFTTNSEELYQDLTASIRRCGAQTWEPARPNPSMTDVVLAVARSLEDRNLKKGRTHIVLLSPAAYVLHEVSKTYPDLSIHRINPAALPYLRETELQDAVCFDACCRNVFASNWTSYQSIPGRIKRIMKNARSKNPVGDLTNVFIDVRMRDGCELVECFGRKDVPQLRLGLVHTVFAKVRVNRTQTQAVDLNSINPVFNSSLDVKSLRQDLKNATALGAIKVHLLDVQLYYRNSTHTIDCWNYAEAPFITVLKLGTLAPPIDSASEVYKRVYFHKFVQLTTEEARDEAKTLLAAPYLGSQAARKVIEHIYHEAKCQVKFRKYEQDFRQKLPLCSGPIDLEVPHEWLSDMWNKRQSKRNGVAAKGEILGLINGLERLASM